MNEREWFLKIFHIQVVYVPRDFAQYVEPPENQIWTVGTESAANNDTTVLSFESRGPNSPEDIRMQSHFDKISTVSLFNFKDKLWASFWVKGFHYFQNILGIYFLLI